MTTVIVRCTCVSPFQDEEHGKGNRVHNSTAKSMGRCTVCKRETPMGGVSDSKGGKKK